LTKHQKVIYFEYQTILISNQSISINGHPGITKA